MFGQIKILKSRNLEIKVRDELGIKQKLLSQKEVLELEPNLNPVFDAGVIYEMLCMLEIHMEY